MTNLKEGTGECEKATLHVYTRILNPGTVLESLDVTVKGEKKNSGKLGLASFENLEVGKPVDVEVDLGGEAEKLAWKTVDTPVVKVPYMIKLGDVNHLGFEAVPLPKIKATVYRAVGTSLKPEPKIEVVVTPSGGTEVKLPTADGTGVAQFNNLKKGTYKVEVKLTDPQLETFVLPPAQENIILTLGVEKALTFQLKVKGTLKVEVERFDKRALSQAAKITLKELATGKKLPAKDTVSAQNPDGNTPWGVGEFKLAPGRYEVTIEPQKNEKEWKIIPRKGLDIPVEVEGDKTAELLCTLSPYKKVQFIGFDIRPGTKDKKHYLGEKDADTDIERRCKVMKEAIKAAAGGSIDAAISTLKVFMAPEFYYRGAEGGYPVEKISRIMDPKIDTSMPEETDKGAYKHWLFVLGTAIGYLAHEKVGDSGKPGWSGSKLLHKVGPMQKAALRIEELNRIGNIMKVRVGVSLADRFAAKGTTVWHLRQMVPTEATQEVIQAEAVNGRDETWLHLKEADAFQNGADVLLETSEESIYIRGIGTIQNTPNDPEQTCLLVKGALFRSIIPNRSGTSKIRWKVIQKHRPFDLERTIERVADGPNGIQDEYWLVLDSKADFNAEKPIEVSEPIAAEIFNVALVRRGGPVHDDWAPGLRQAVVFKEYVSPIDYLGKHYNKGSFHKEDGSGREVIIYGKTRTVLPTAGSRDMLGDSGPVNASEINKSGEGGGCVITMDGVTYGVEICLDHAMQRVYKFYVGGPAQPKDPKPQVILIPSWGMSIGGGPTFGLLKTPIFNVDGGGGGLVARMHEKQNTCEEHGAQVSGGAPHSCPEPECQGFLVGPKVKTSGGAQAVAVAGQDELFEGSAQVIVFEAAEIPDAEVV